MKDFLTHLQALVTSHATARALRCPHRSCRGLIKFKDFCQDVLLRAIKHHDAFRGKTTAELLGWLQAIGRQLAAQLRRAPHPYLGQALPPDLADRDRTLAADEADHEEELAANSLVIARAIAALGPDDRSLMRRHYWGRESLADIAQDLGRSRNTVTQHHGRILRRLRARCKAMGVW